MFCVLLTFLLLPAAGEVSGQVLLEPQNVTVLQGSDARFNCSVSGEWKAMSWLLNGNVVLTISREYGVLGNDSRFSAINYSGDRWELNLKSVWRNESGEVTCGVQTFPSQRASLCVQERGAVSIVGGNRTVTEGQHALLQCVASGWFPEPVLSWLQNATEVDPGRYNTSSKASDGLFESTSNLSIVAVNSTSLECQATISALSSPESSVVYLVVDTVKVTTHTDWTVLIAVTVSMGGVALLVLLIFGIVFCCKKREAAKSSYQEEVIRRSRIEKRPGSAQSQGHRNLGYTTEEDTNVPRGDVNGSGLKPSTQLSEIPDVVNSNQAASCHNDPHSVLGVKKHRHATIV